MNTYISDRERRPLASIHLLFFPWWKNQGEKSARSSGLCMLWLVLLGLLRLGLAIEYVMMLEAYACSLSIWWWAMLLVAMCYMRVMVPLILCFMHELRVLPWNKVNVRQHISYSRNGLALIIRLRPLWSGRHTRCRIPSHEHGEKTGNGMFFCVFVSFVIVNCAAGDYTPNTVEQ